MNRPIHYSILFAAAVCGMLYVISDPLLPDLVVLPARDLTLMTTVDCTVLQFSTTYYNTGSGPLELTANTVWPIDNRYHVFQRLTMRYGWHIGLLAGTFEWHPDHYHYHFSDFITYRLERIDPSGTDVSIRSTKTSFCVRDAERMKPGPSGNRSQPHYTVCDKKSQGVSVGWGDTYYYDYPGQEIHVCTLPSGMYRLSHEINPDGQFIESDYSNNTSSVVFHLDKQRNTITVIKEYIPAGF